MLSKQEEIERLHSFVNCLPDHSLLKGYFTPALFCHIENQIANDFGFIDWEIFALRKANYGPFEEAVNTPHLRAEDAVDAIEEVGKLGSIIPRQGYLQSMFPPVILDELEKHVWEGRQTLDFRQLAYRMADMIDCARCGCEKRPEDMATCTICNSCLDEMKKESQAV